MAALAGDRDWIGLILGQRVADFSLADDVGDVPFVGEALRDDRRIGSGFRGKPDSVGHLVTLVLGVPLDGRGSRRGLDSADSAGMELSERQGPLRHEPFFVGEWRLFQRCSLSAVRDEFGEPPHVPHESEVFRTSMKID
jgi:hypothetical protein